MDDPGMLAFVRPLEAIRSAAQGAGDHSRAKRWGLLCVVGGAGVSGVIAQPLRNHAGVVDHHLGQAVDLGDGDLPGRAAHADGDRDRTVNVVPSPRSE